MRILQAAVMLALVGLVLLALLGEFGAHGAEQDKVLHASVAYGVTVSGVTLLQKAGLKKLPAQLATSFLVMSAGVVKESMDSRADGGDLVANGIGTVAGCAFTWAF